MKVNFVTPTRLSLSDLSTMGDSLKRTDSSTLGQFDSGLKYAIALLLRAEVDISIQVHKEEESVEYFSFETYNQSCEKRDKELIQINVFKGEEVFIHKTGFAKALGYNWELWMALRELWSNMLDEGGEIIENPDIIEGTVMTLTFEDDNPFKEIWDNKHLYINEKEPLFKVSSGLEILENKEGFLRIYKQNILVYSDEKVSSRFAFNIGFGEIDERRILSNLYSVETKIAEKIMYSSNDSFLQTIILNKFSIGEKEFLGNVTFYSNASDLIHNIAIKVYETSGEVESYPWLLKAIKRRNDCKIGGKVITSVSDSLWTYSSDVVIESTPEIPKEEESLKNSIEKKYNFKLDVETKIAKLKGSRVIADKYENILILDEGFNIEEDMAELLVQYLDLTDGRNIIKSLSEYIVNLIKL